MLGQLLIHYVSMDFSKSGRALGYVSIAGTIVSIMLGFIAIIYSFVQSITHSNSVAEIKTQVEKLIEAGHGISSLEEGLQRSAKKIRSATKSLTLHLNENTSVSEKMYSEMENLKHAYARESSDAKVGQATSKAGALAPLESRWVLLEVSYLMVYHAAIKEVPVTEFHTNVIAPYAAKIDWGDRFIAGAFATTSMLLQQDDVVCVEKVGKGVNIKKGDNFQARLGAISLQAEDYSSEETVTYLELFGDEIRAARAAATHSE